MTTAPGRDVILYDGACRICLGFIQKHEPLFRKHGAELRSFREEGVLAAYPGITPEMCDEGMQLVEADGRVSSGMEAIVRSLGWSWWGKLLFVYFVPGLRQLMNAGYRMIARNRFRIGGRVCEDGTCAVPFKPERTQG